MSLLNCPHAGAVSINILTPPLRNEVSKRQKDPEDKGIIIIRNVKIIAGCSHTQEIYPSYMTMQPIFFFAFFSFRDGTMGNELFIPSGRLP